MNTETRKIRLIGIKPGMRIVETEDELATDETTCIFVNGVYHVSLIATPDMRKELAVGYLASEGVIGSLGDIESISIWDNDVLVDLNREVDLLEASIEVMNLARYEAGGHG